MGKKCPKCGKEFAVDDSCVSDGDLIKCPECGYIFQIKKSDKKDIRSELNKAQLLASIIVAVVFFIFVIPSFILSSHDTLLEDIFFPSVKAEHLPDKRDFSHFLETNYSDYNIISIEPEVEWTYGGEGFERHRYETGWLKAIVKRDGEKYIICYRDGKVKTDIYVKDIEAEIREDILMPIGLSKEAIDGIELHVNGSAGATVLLPDNICHFDDLIDINNSGSIYDITIFGNFEYNDEQWKQLEDIAKNSDNFKHIFQYTGDDKISFNIELYPLDVTKPGEWGGSFDIDVNENVRVILYDADLHDVANYTIESEDKVEYKDRESESQAIKPEDIESVVVNTESVPESEIDSKTGLKVDYMNLPVFDYDEHDEYYYMNYSHGIITDFDTAFTFNGNYLHMDVICEETSPKTEEEKDIFGDYKSRNGLVNSSVYKDDRQYRMSMSLDYAYNFESNDAHLRDFAENTPKVEDDLKAEFNGLVLGKSNYSDVRFVLGEPDMEYEEYLPNDDGTEYHSICMIYRSPNNTYAEIWCSVFDELHESVISSITLQRLRP